MATATAVGAYGPGGPAALNEEAIAAVPVVPFDQASHEGLEPGPTFTFRPGGAQVNFGPAPLPAQGYLKFVWLEITSLNGVGGTGAGDFPWNILNLVRLQDTNGAPMTELTGYNLFLANTYGGYNGSPDPRTLPDYAATANAPRFHVVIPVQISDNGLGSLANQSAAASYKLTVIGETSALIWSVAPGTIPDITIRTYCEFWTLPAQADMMGRPQEQDPPFNGVAQYWSQSMNNAVALGQNRTQITRTGGLLRTVIFVARVAGVRADTPFPDPVDFSWDSRDLKIMSASVLRSKTRQQTIQLSARDVGVYPFIFSTGESSWAGGDNAINSWLPTVTATRLEITGTSAAAGTLDIIVNDVSVAETAPAARAVETSATGYHPPIAPSVIGAQ
jgi:hypothetical protein